MTNNVQAASEGAAFQAANIYLETQQAPSITTEKGLYFTIYDYPVTIISRKHLEIPRCFLPC